MAKGTKVRSIDTGWTGTVSMAGTTIVQVVFRFETFGGKARTIKSAWRVSDLEVMNAARD